MKKIKSMSIAFILCILLVGCKNEELSTDFTIAGTIADYTTGTIDSIKFVYLDNDYLLGEGKVSSSGQFSIKIPTPEVHKIGKSFNDIAVSDTNALVSSFIISYGYKGGVKKGFVFKTNFTNFSSTNDNETTLMFFFSDRPLTIKGTMSHSTDSYSEIYDLVFKKGWNEFITSTDYTKTNPYSIHTISYSNTIPSDLKWRYIPVIHKVE